MTTPSGMVYISGQWFMKCGSNLIPVRYVDSKGEPVRPVDVLIDKATAKD